ncbi:hypothetical protein, partial [Ectobacillus funiculus]|uniref:hypothetical protein n=1 Tax=Ectobacillus funiculus TaxID=137993 RepID=UPI00196A4180
EQIRPSGTFKSGGQSVPIRNIIDCDCIRETNSSINKKYAVMVFCSSIFSGCRESFLHSLFLCLNTFSSFLSTLIEKMKKERSLMMGALKHHRDERVTVL